MKKDRIPGSHAAVRSRERPEKKKAARPQHGAVRQRSHTDPKRVHLALVLAGAAVLLMILLAAVLIGSADKREYRGYMSQAEESYQTGDYDSALSFLRKAANIECSDECLMLMVDCYTAQQNYEKALEVLRRMDVSDAAVAKRIADVEQRRSQLLEEKRISIGGRQFPLGAASLVLDGMELEDSDLKELSKFRCLNDLSLADNSLKDISALSEFRSLAALNLNDNSISDISALKKLTGLRALYLDNNPLKDLSPLLSLTNLTVLSIKGINISETQLEKLSAALPSCAIHSDVNPDDAMDITLGGLTFKSDVTELDLSGRGIRDISALESCKELVKLDLSGNEISDLIALMNIPGLEWLDVSDNELTDLRPLIGLGTLRVINASGNNISSTSAAGAMTALTELYLSDNPISDFSGLKKLRNLQTLGLKNTGIDDGGLQYLEYLSSLALLELDDNPAMSGEAVDKLQSALGSCVISHSELVYSVDFSGVSVRADATELDLTGKGLTDISGMSSMNCLETVKLSKNNISNIYIFQYTDSWDTITYLDLSSNSLEDITPVASFINLESLNLANNRINSIQPLMRLENLRSLDISGNLLTDEQIKTLKETLTNCEIKS